MGRIVPNQNYDWVYLNDDGTFGGFLDHQGEPVAIGVGSEVTLNGAQVVTNKSLGAGTVFTVPPTGLTKAMVGLSAVANLAPQDLPISDLTALALAAKQAALASGTNIKTINGTSVLGSGDLVVAGGGAAGEVTVSYSDAFPFDAAGFGKTSNLVTLSANKTVTEAGGGITGGTYHVTYRQNATGGFTWTPPAGWVKRGSDSFGTAPGATTEVVAAKQDTGEVIYALVPLATVDTTAPTYGSHTIAEGSPTKIIQVMSEAVVANGIVNGDVTTTNAGGRTLSSIAFVGSNVEFTYNSAFTYDVVPSIAIAAGKIKDLAGNLAGALSTSVVTNNRTIPVPNSVAAPTLGTATDTTQPISWSAPTATSSFGPATLYQPQYKLHASGTWLNFGSTISGTSTTVTGLTASSSYDYRVISSNGTGTTSGTAGISTGSTTAAPSSAYVTPSTEFVDGALPSQTAETLADSGTGGGDYIVCRGNSNTPLRRGDSPFGSPVGLLTGPTDTNINLSTRTQCEPGDASIDHITMTQPAGEGGETNQHSASYQPTTTGVAMARDFVAPAIAGQQNTIRVSFCFRRYEWGDSSTPIGMRLTLTLSDGSVAPVNYDISGTVGEYDYMGGQFKVDYKPTTTGTILISCRELPSMIAHQAEGFYTFGVHSVIYTPGT